MSDVHHQPIHCCAVSRVVQGAGHVELSHRPPYSTLILPSSPKGRLAVATINFHTSFLMKATPFLICACSSYNWGEPERAPHRSRQRPPYVVMFIGASLSEPTLIETKAPVCGYICIYIYIYIYMYYWERPVTQNLVRCQNSSGRTSFGCHKWSAQAKTGPGIHSTEDRKFSTLTLLLPPLYGCMTTSSWTTPFTASSLCHLDGWLLRVS